MMKSRLFGALFVVLITLISASAADAALIAYFPFEGDANDASGNGVHGTVSGDTSLTTGKIGQGYAFDGSGDYIGVPLNISPGGLPQLTMGAWAKTSGFLSHVQQIIGSDDGGYDRSLDLDLRNGTGSPGSVWRWSAFAGSTGGVLPGSNTTVDQWAFVAVVFDQTAPTDKVRLYVNGSVFTRNTTLGSGTSTPRIGASPTFGEWFNGVIDEVFFFDTALTNTELGNIMANGVQPVPVPGTLLLLVSGLLGLAGLTKRG